MWGETRISEGYHLRHRDFNPLSPCGERRVYLLSAYHVRISIHSPRVGRDCFQLPAMPGSTDFNPLSPCGERPSHLSVPALLEKFQSTLPMRGETLCAIDQYAMSDNFNPLSPCGERQALVQESAFPSADFNPLSPCGERRISFWGLVFYTLFQSTLPMRGETCRPDSVRTAVHDFNPLSPCGERLDLPSGAGLGSYFNPLSPCGERRICCALSFPCG